MLEHEEAILRVGEAEHDVKEDSSCGLKKPVSVAVLQADVASLNPGKHCFNGC